MTLDNLIAFLIGVCIGNAIINTIKCIFGGCNQ